MCLHEEWPVTLFCFSETNAAIHSKYEDTSLQISGLQSLHQDQVLSTQNQWTCTVPLTEWINSKCIFFNWLYSENVCVRLTLSVTHVVSFCISHIRLSGDRVSGCTWTGEHPVTGPILSNLPKKILTVPIHRIGARGYSVPNVLYSRNTCTCLPSPDSTGRKTQWISQSTMKPHSGVKNKMFVTLPHI